MNEKEICNQLDVDLQLSEAQKVIYLEGQDDVNVFFGLIGVAKPASNQHQGVLVKDLGGSKKVETWVKIGVNHKPNHFYGILDGDGRSYHELASRFDPPYAGPLYFWKTYCIENLLARSVWPTAWGDPPSWKVELERYAPYVALNRIYVELRKILETLRLAKFNNPSGDQMLETAVEMCAALRAGKHEISGYDIESKFSEEHTEVLRLIDSDPNELHARLNGKWLIEHFAYGRTGRRKFETIRGEWAEHARSIGGLPEVCELWQRITGNLP